MVLYTRRHDGSMDDYGNERRDKENNRRKDTSTNMQLRKSGMVGNHPMRLQDLVPRLQEIRQPLAMSLLKTKQSYLQ